MVATGIIESVFSSYFEIHLFELGVATGMIAIWMLHRVKSRLLAGGVIMVGLLAMYSAYIVHEWRVHPWYYTSALAATLISYETYQNLKSIPQRLRQMKLF